MITAGPSEADAADAVAADAARAAGAAAAAIVRCGEPSLEELEVIVTRARLFIGGDSGPLHVAATTAVPVVALFGPTLPARSMPWRSPALHGRSRSNRARCPAGPVTSARACPATSGA